MTCLVAATMAVKEKVKIPPTARHDSDEMSVGVTILPLLLSINMARISLARQPKAAWTRLWAAKWKSSG